MIEESGVRALDTYATTTEYKSEIPLDDIRNGVVPLDSLPAAWWNWLWNQVTLEEGHIKVALDAIIEEIKSVLASAEVVPSAASNNQLLAAIVKVSQRYGSPDEAGAVKSSDTPGKVKIETDGTMTANGLGSTAELTTTLKTSVVQAINELVVRADTQDNNWNTKVNDAETRLSNQYTEAVTTLDTKLTARFEELQRTVDLPKYELTYDELVTTTTGTATVSVDDLCKALIKAGAVKNCRVYLKPGTSNSSISITTAGASFKFRGIIMLEVASVDGTEESVTGQSIRIYLVSGINPDTGKTIRDVYTLTGGILTKQGPLIVSSTGSGSAVTGVSLSEYTSTLTVTKGNPITLSTSGSGNAVTGVSLSGSTLTVTKGNPITLSTSGSGNTVTNVSLSGSTLTVTKGYMSYIIEGSTTPSAKSLSGDSFYFIRLLDGTQQMCFQMLSVVLPNENDRVHILGIVKTSTVSGACTGIVKQSSTRFLIYYLDTTSAGVSQESMLISSSDTTHISLSVLLIKQ